MSVERLLADDRLSEDLRALDRLCAFISVEAKALKVPEAEALSSAVSRRIGELLSIRVRH